MTNILNKKKIILLSAIILFIIATIVILVIIKNITTTNNQMKNAIHAVTIKENVDIYSSKKMKRKKDTVKIGTDAYILDNLTTEDGEEIYKVKVNKKTGYVFSSDLGYYKKAKNEKELMVDVSQFNMNDSFSNIGEFKAFLINNDIKYVYIRAGGMGYGKAGNLYEDTKYKEFADACEFLKVPFGFYFLEEALTSAEIDKEVNFIKDFLNKNDYKYSTLPVALDIEKHDEPGRADDIWEHRYILTNELIKKLKNEEIPAIVYSNASIANEYLEKVETNMWLAYYPGVKETPNYWLSETDSDAAENEEVLSKMIAWQYTDAGIENYKKIDMSIVKSSYFKDLGLKEYKKIN